MDGNIENSDKPIPKHGGKYGKLTRPSRAKKRRYHPPKNAKTKNAVNIEGEILTSVVESIVAEPMEVALDEEDVSSVIRSTNEVIETSASATKLKPVTLTDTLLCDSSSPECFVIMDTSQHSFFFQKLKPRCPECNCMLKFTHEIKKKTGLAHFFRCSCICDCLEDCHWHETLCTSKPTKRIGRQRRPGFEVNMRSIIAFREIGRGLKSLKDFCRIMNIPPPMDKKAYKKSFTHLYRAYSVAARESIETAAAQVIGTVDELGVTNTIASFDGTWQRRGYSSLNGVVSCISNGKVIDYEVLSKVCHECKYWNNHIQDQNYDNWSVDHSCSIDHKGSAGSMEVNGVKAIFNRSISQNKLRYTTYLADGDSKAYQEVRNSNCYPMHPIEKAECIGHVQKRVGARQRTYIANYKGVILDDGKRLTGPGRLTNKVMNTLQNYYGLVMRADYSHLSEEQKLYKMKKSIAAIIHHCSECLDDNNQPGLAERHKFCPKGKDSWCKYQQDCVTGLSTYKAKINLPVAVSKVIKPIFSHADLGGDNLLKKCLHGQTQNANESFNQCIWKKAPKETFDSRKTLEVAVASAFTNFNDGANGILKILVNCAITPGYYSTIGALNENNSQITAMNRKSSERVKKVRKKIHAQREGFTDKNADDTYIPGGH